MLCRYPQFDQKVGGIRPCGQCLHCRKNQRRKKTTRLTLESKHHEHILFVTLTYSDEFLPRDVFDFDTGELLASHPLGCLDKRAVQLFLKRLRKKLPPRSLRVFYAGEYGDKKGRPHYHFILWGLPYSKKLHIFDSWTDPVTGTLMCDPDYLDVQIPKSNWDVSQYCNSYILKRMTNADDVRLQGRTPEFGGSSKGIASNAVDMLVQAFKNPSAQFYIDCYKDIPRELIMDGKRYPIDRYLRGKIISALGIEKMATETAFQAYQKTMQELRTRAIDNFASSSQPSIGYLMETQHVRDNEQKMKNAEALGDLYNSQKGDF